VNRTRAARIGRHVAGWLAALLAVALLTALTSGDEASERPSDEETQRGGQLFATNCTVCHGATGEGGTGPGLRAAPPIDDIEVAYADLVIRTGRMPIVDREAGILRDPQLDATDREQIVAWMAQTFDLEGEVPVVPHGDTARGRLLFNAHCAACHSTTGWGGITGDGVVARPVRDLDRVAIHSAARIGPFEMPSFSASVLSDEDLADIAAAIERMDEERPSRATLIDLTHVSGMVYSLVAVVVLVGLLVLVSHLPSIAAKDEEFEFEDRDEDRDDPGTSP
jgi:ubiquinol-cytochrome c reductase cytochrome c subunit